MAHNIISVSPFIQQLKGLRWEHIEGNIAVPYLTERESFRQLFTLLNACRNEEEIPLPGP